jgi:hypothetical protein
LVSVFYMLINSVVNNTDIQTYHSHFIPEGAAEVSQIFLQETYVFPKLLSYEADVTGGKAIYPKAVLSIL